MIIKNTINKYCLSCILCLASFIFFAQTKSSNIQTIDGKTYYIHTVEKGQSLYSVSKLYNVSLEDIYNVNPELKAGVKASQEIKIPTGATAVKTATTAVATNTQALNEVDTLKYFTYRISKGETVYSITKKFNLTQAQLTAYNPSISQGLKEGQLIAIGEKNKRKNVKEAFETATTIVSIDTSKAKVISKSFKPKYNVALILPFKLDQTLALDMVSLAKSKSSFPFVSAYALDFYLGFKNAVDSLTTKDFEINLELYDEDDKDSLNHSQLISDLKTKQIDFIFGPLYANGFKTIAHRAKELSIPIITPITQQNKMLFNNAYASKTNPSQYTLLESLADYCIDSLVKNNAKIFLVSPFQKDKKEIAYINAFKKYYNEKQKLLGKSNKDTITIVKGLDGIKSGYTPNAKNVVVTLSTNQVFIADFTTQLAIFSDKKDFVLCGWQNTSTLDNIDQEYLNLLSFTFPHQYNISATPNAASVEHYKKIQESYPTEFYFIGHDIANYYLKNLKEWGPDFIFTLNNLTQETDYLRFKFYRPDNTTGFDNRGVFIFKYNNYQLQKTGWK
ncbi:MAG: LysM peptidoglycan-binding domain-containing protein [Bacteroidota bacterium]|nr:LysM peptidoglycan-binding domain-containing protein [Bacteroidota bacterium]MDP3144197.1 LysM peptidoglycan-binding domain-containing protein [Bacteroidota bacterium]